MPYAITGVALALLFLAAAVFIRVWVDTHGGFDGPVPTWFMRLDRLIAPPGIIGVALLVLAWLERRLALLAFTAVYLVIVLVPVTFGWESHSSVRMEFLPAQVISGTVLLLGGLGFLRAARRRDR